LTNKTITTSSFAVELGFPDLEKKFGKDLPMDFYLEAMYFP